MRAIVKWIFIWLPPVALTAILFWGVLRSGSPAPFPRTELPKESFVAERCTWVCHNHGCRHPSRLPDFLTGDSGLFGKTVRLLHRAGSAIMPAHPNQGYGVVNLLLFCVAWPGFMLWLYAIVVRQRLELREMDRARRGLP
jgi:hypothetical protein